MALVTGYVLKVGVIGSAEPVGQITVVPDLAAPTVGAQQIRCPSGPRLELGILAFTNGYTIEVDVLQSTNPMVADKIRVT